MDSHAPFATMLRVDFIAPPWRGGVMDDAAALLGIELCTHAGMLMEDASILALRLRTVAPDDRREVLSRLIVTSEQIGYLLNGARSLQA